MVKSGLTALVAAGTLALAAPPAAADLSDGKVKIGILTDMANIYADIGGPGSQVAAEMAIEDFGGTVLGTEVELTVADHQNKADIASAVANRWFDAEEVDMVADIVTSSVALAVYDIARNKDRIALVSGAATSRLTGDKCSPNGAHWAYDTYAMANGTGRAVVRDGGNSWYFITADYAFGHQLEADTTAAVEAEGGEILGSVRAPFPNQDFSSFLLEAQASGAEVIGLANAGGDTINTIKQAAEFGIVDAGQRLAGMLMFITDVHSLGLETAQGLVFTTAFYWDADEETRAWSARFEERAGQKPSMVQAGVYSSVLHYLKAVEAAGTDDAATVMAKMRELPINDFFTKDGVLREDGRVIRDMHLVEVKSPDESEGPWDYLNVLQTIAGEDAFRPMDAGDCELVK